MPLQCNIDAKGKLLRLVIGLVEILAAIVIAIVWAMPAASALAWTIAVALFVFGAFAVFEARAGWCVMRAMGFKTRL